MTSNKILESREHQWKLHEGRPLSFIILYQRLLYLPWNRHSMGIWTINKYMNKYFQWSKDSIWFIFLKMQSNSVVCKFWDSSLNLNLIPASLRTVPIHQVWDPHSNAWSASLYLANSSQFILTSKQTHTILLVEIGYCYLVTVVEMVKYGYICG